MTGRPDPYVLARFLDALVETPGAKPKIRSKSSLQRACRVNYDVFRRYVEFCVRQGFITVVPAEEPGDADEVRITEAGRAAHRKLVDWIRDLLGDVRL